MNRSFLLYGVDQSALAIRSDKTGRLRSVDLEDLFIEGSFYYLGEPSPTGFGFRAAEGGEGECFKGAKLIATDLDGPGPLAEDYEGVFLYHARRTQVHRSHKAEFQEYMMLKNEGEEDAKPTEDKAPASLEPKKQSEAKGD